MREILGTLGLFLITALASGILITALGITSKKGNVGFAAYILFCMLWGVILWARLSKHF